VETAGGPILSIAFSPEGTSLVSAGAFESCIRIWDPRSGRLDRILSGHAYTTTGVAFCPGGGMLATTGGDGLVKLWNVSTGRLLHRLVGHSAWLGSVAFSPNGKIIAATGGDGNVRMWDLDELRGTKPEP
jgi:WD40 repeat protein